MWDEAAAPNEIRARRFRLGGDELLVLSYRLLPDASSARLTRAEQAVVGALLNGASNADIARARGRSVNTIAKQIASVFRKLGVRSRLELAHRLAGCALELEPAA